jgi:hypothetical protein
MVKLHGIPAGSKLTTEARRMQSKRQVLTQKYFELCELCALCGEISCPRCAVNFLPGAAVIEISLNR